MDRSLKAISLLLSYPSEDLTKAMPEISAVLASDPRLTIEAKEQLEPVFDALSKGNAQLYTSQEIYVSLFDRSRTLSLNLFEHIHGESRDRGSAMVSLLETYRDAGFEPVSSELPDHVPALLEFLSTRSQQEIRSTLQDAGHIFEALRTRLERRESYYAPIFSALLQLANVKLDDQAVALILEEPDADPNDLEALDEVWQETEVTFGPDPNAGCPNVRDMLSQMDLPARLSSQK